MVYPSIKVFTAETLRWYWESNSRMMLTTGNRGENVQDIEQENSWMCSSLRHEVGCVGEMAAGPGGECWAESRKTQLCFPTLLVQILCTRGAQTSQWELNPQKWWCFTRSILCYNPFAQERPIMHHYGNAENRKCFIPRTCALEQLRYPGPWSSLERDGLF